MLDLINTDKSAKELLERRAVQINASGRYENELCCSSGEYVERLRMAGHAVHVVDTPRGLSPVGILRAIFKTFRLLRDRKYEVVHTHGSVVGVIGRVAAWLARTRFVVHQVHGFHHHDVMGRLQQWVFIKVEWALAFISDRLLFQNQADIEECVRCWIAPRRKLVRIGNGVQLDDFAPGDEPANDPPVVLYVARFEPVKNHPLLLEAARLLHERGVRFVLRLVGDGDLRPEYERWVSAHDLAGCVEFLGYRDDVPALTSSAEVCVLISLKEGLPRALIEAAACGRPAVATDVVGNRDTVVDGKTGFLVPLGDAGALADKLEQLLTDEDLRRRIGAEAREHARQNFDERAVTDRIIAVFDEMSDGR